jgi:integrase/recombinase XerC
MGRRALDRNELLELYCEYLLEIRHRSKRTWRDYHRTLVAFWDHAGKPPARCRPGDLHRFIDRRTVPGGNAHGVRLEDSTGANYARNILRFYTVAYARGWLGSNPMRDVSPPPAALGPPRALELEDVARLLGHVAIDRRMLLAVWLAYGCGLRCAEIASLRREHLRLGRRPQLTVTGKGNRTRLIPLHKHVATELRAALDDGLTVGPVIASKVIPGRPLAAKTVSHLLSAALHGAGVKATGHQLRHTFATELLAAGKGANLRAVSRLLGHSSVAVTERYVSAYDQDTWDTIALLPDPRMPPATNHAGAVGERAPHQNARSSTGC